MSPRLELGALDFTRLGPSSDPGDAVWSTIQLAGALESLGYSRLWLGEHHTKDVGHSCPETLLTLIAAATSSLRVGTAGILLRYYSPLKVAKTFRLLNTVFPDRVELGIAKGFVDPQIARHLVENLPDVDPFQAKIETLIDALHGRCDVPVNPVGIAPPPVWLLGSGSATAELAARVGASVCFSLFLGEPINKLGDVIATYCDRFTPNETQQTPAWGVAIAGVCAENVERASSLASEWGAGVKASIVGSPDVCAERILDLCAFTRTGHVVFLDMCLTDRDKNASYVELARALRLSVTVESASVAAAEVRQ